MFSLLLRVVLIIEIVQEQGGHVREDDSRVLQDELVHAGHATPAVLDTAMAQLALPQHNVVHDLLSLRDVRVGGTVAHRCHVLFSLAL